VVVVECWGGAGPSAFRIAHLAWPSRMSGGGCAGQLQSDQAVTTFCIMGRRAILLQLIILSDCKPQSNKKHVLNKFNL
jgi:hypothetical protein